MLLFRHIYVPEHLFERYFTTFGPLSFVCLPIINIFGQTHAAMTLAEMEGPAPLTPPAVMCARARPTSEGCPARRTHHVSTANITSH